MAFSNDILRPLTDMEIQNLENLYGNNFINTNFHYLTIHNQTKWLKKIKCINISDKNTEFWTPFRTSFYTHRSGNFAVNGTFVSITKDLKTMISFHTLESSFQELKECLCKTNRINWVSGPLFTGVRLEYLPFVNEIAARNGAIVQKGRKCICFSIENKLGRKLNETKIPFGYEIKKLSLFDAKRIHEEWPNNKEGSLNFVQGLIILNKSYGIIKQDNNELVAWVLQNEYGGLGILQVMPNKRRMGLGTALAVEMTKDICNSEPINTVAFTIEENIKSQELFKKIGFKKTVETMWIQYENVTNDSIVISTVTSQ